MAPASLTGRGAAGLGRRAALLLPLGALAGCSTISSWFESTKTPLPGRREDVLPSAQGLQLPPGPRPRVALPAPVLNPEWPQPGGDPAHVLGNLRTGGVLSEAWRVPIGEGGGFRRKITAQPVVAGGRVFAMDSNAVVSAFDARNGERLWRFKTRAKGNRSSNVGGGLAEDGGVLYASTGRGDLVALDAARGTPRWRQQVGMPLRSPPTVAEGRVFVTTLDQKLLAISAAGGHTLWSHQAATAQTLVLGDAAPAYAEGIVVAGFGAGDLLALRADTGDIVWADSITASGERATLADISAISAMPLIQGERVFALGQAGLLIANDLRTGRRIWEREVAGSQTPWLAGDWLFLVTLEQRTAAMNAADGQISWLSSLPRWKNVKKEKNPIEWYGPVLAGGRLIFTGNNEQAAAVDPHNGAVLGHLKLPAPAPFGPVVAGGTVYFVAADGTMLAYR